MRTTQPFRYKCASQSPFINQQREGALCQRGIRIRAYDYRLGGSVKPQVFLAMPPTGGRLAAPAGTHDQDGGVVDEQVAEQRMDCALRSSAGAPGITAITLLTFGLNG